MGVRLTAAAAWTVAVVAAAQSPTENPIRLNTVGYAPHSVKVATFAGEARSARVIDAATGREVIQAKLRPASGNQGGKALGWVDFSGLQQPGVYRLAIDGVGQSPPFRVAADTHVAPLRAAMLAMRLWRCGPGVRGEHDGQLFEHGPCHNAPARLDHVGRPGQTRDVSGGWHDAGDYNLYVVNGAFTAGMLLHAWERRAAAFTTLTLAIPETGGPIPDLLDEVAWELRWLLKMQDDDGSVFHKLSTEEFGGMVLPGDDTAPRYLCPWSSAATADFAAALAKGARALAPFDKPFAETCLAAARRAQKFLDGHPGDHQADQSAFKTGPYDAVDPGHRLWALAELWETTGEAPYLEAFESEVRRRAATGPGPTESLVHADWDWKDLTNLATLTYLKSQRPGRNPALVARVREDLLATADSLVGTAERDPYARALGPRYYWGSAGSVARTAVALEHANALTGDRRYADTARDAINHLLGRNDFGRSFVTGVGWRPPQFPHDRRSAADSVEAPWPGYLIGGPHPTAIDWRDKEEDYFTNEFAVNWNGALVFALATQLEPAVPLE